MFAYSGSSVSSNSMQIASTNVRVSFDVVVELIPFANINLNVALGGQNLWTLTMPVSQANKNPYTSGSGVNTTITYDVTPPSSTLPTMENSYWYHIQLDIPNYSGSTAASLVYTLSATGRQVYVDNVVVQNIQNPLPVQITNVSLTNNVISWKSGTEINVDKYIVQGSNDNVNWVNVTTVEATNQPSYSVSV